jgi:hypothetical protein
LTNAHTAGKPLATVAVAGVSLRFEVMEVMSASVVGFVKNASVEGGR